MSTDYNTNPTAVTTAGRDNLRVPEQRRRTTETKAATKTTELIAYVVAVVGVLIASVVVGEGGGEGDAFRAERAWLFITVLTVGYMISRGLAKAGSREHYDA